MNRLWYTFGKGGGRVLYESIELSRDVDVAGLYTIHYYEYNGDFVFEGERHDFWELISWTRARSASRWTT